MKIILNKPLTITHLTIARTGKIKGEKDVEYAAGDTLTVDVTDEERDVTHFEAADGTFISISVHDFAILPVTEPEPVSTDVLPELNQVQQPEQ